MEKRNVELILLTGLKVVAVGAVAYLAYFGFAALFPQDRWPPADERQEEAAVEHYKQKLLRGDSPLSPRTPEDTAVYLSRIIDHEVKKGDLRTGREYIGQAIDQQLDSRVESLAGRPDTKVLMARVREGRAKRDGLSRLAACYERRPGATAGREEKDRFERELQEMVEKFCDLPFDPSACPELAEEMVATYQTRLAGFRQDPRLRKVSDEVERNCRPRRQEPKE